MKSRCATDSVAYFFCILCRISALYGRCLLLSDERHLLHANPAEAGAASAFFLFSEPIPVLLQGRCLRRCGRNPGGYSGDFSLSARIVSVALLVVDGAVVLRIFVRCVRNPVVERDFGLQQLFVDQVFVAFAACESVVLRGDDGAVVGK